MTKVFISYKSQERAFAQFLRDTCASWGCDTWLDIDNIPIGTYFREQIQMGLESSDVIIGVMTPEALKSREVMSEWDYAIRHKRLVPLRYRECPVMYHLEGVQYIDFLKLPEATALAKLKTAILDSKVELTSTVFGRVRKTRTVDSIEATNRTRLLEKVNSFWIEGVLENVLNENPLIGLDLQTKPDAVLRHVVYGDYPLPDSAEIPTVFRDLHRELLILGAPGAGKTTLMLGLAKYLLKVAAQDTTQPVPVIMNLSSWGIERGSIKSWILRRLRLEYQVPESVTRAWIDNAALLPMFDGLDEVNEYFRDECVLRINEFREQYRFLDMVVCSRVNELTLLSNRLTLSGAIVLQPLSDRQIELYTSGDELAGVHKLLEVDPIAKHMARTPLLLNAMTYTYRGRDLAEISGISSVERRIEHLFRNYLKKRFTATNSYTLKQTQSQLHWLAHGLQSQNQVVFHIENLQPGWLDIHERVRYMRFSGLIHGFLTAFAFGTVIVLYGRSVHVAHEVLAGWTLSLALFLLVAGIVAQRYVYESVRPYATGVAAGRFIGLAVASSLLLVGATISTVTDNPVQLLLGTIIGCGMGAAAYFMFRRGNKKATNAEQERPTLIRPVEELRYSLLSNLFGGVIAVSSRVSASDLVEQKVIPNQGIWRSLDNSIRNGVVFGIIAGLFALLINNTISTIGWTYLLSPVNEPSVSPTLASIVVGMSAALLVALGGGGFTCLKHLTLRIMLTRLNRVSWDLARFLDFASAIGILRRIGGGYIFVHRYLLEFFSAIESAEDKVAH